MIELSQREIMDLLPKDLAKKTMIDIFQSIDSTNQYLKSFDSHKEMMHVCLTEQQTKGRGRLNRQWYSPSHKNLYFSCLIESEKNMQMLPCLSLVVCLSVYDVLRTYVDEALLKVKWPNDLLYDHEKIAGILIETTGKGHDAHHVIIGIGINVNMDVEESTSIAKSWTALKKILNQDIDRNTLCAKLIISLWQHLYLFEQSGFEPFREAWQAHDLYRDQLIVLLQHGNQISGQCIGLDEWGNLLLKTDDGHVHTFSSGEVTVLR